NSGTIKNCSSKGNVEGQEFTGGFAGINNDKGEISSCKATCDVKSHTYIASINCGGFVGSDAGKIENCCFDGKVDGCVDSEKVVGIAVGVTVGVILAVAVAALLMCYSDKIYKYFDDKHYDAQCNAANSGYDGRNLQLELDKYMTENMSSDPNLRASIGPEVFWKHRYKVLWHKDPAVRLWAEDAYYNILRSKALCFKDFCKKYKKYIPIISLITVFVGTIPDITAGLTAGRKCANLGAFCGINKGEINKCSANNGSLKAKSLYNKHNMCGGFVGINEENGVIKDSVATGSEISNKTYAGGNLGGFVGDNSGKIENGTTTVSVANGKCTGGFCGNNSGEISGSKSEGGAVANAKAVETKCGGFAGNNDKQGKVSSCISIGGAEGQEYVGGFCGDNTGEISKSKSEG
ncbi:MAG: hypothetical protein K2G97_04410, partial [Oscillospiraceae bacterium]|nr:hypothetical protein [Oscillospiraceae bacterium]